jgi:Cytochrome c
MNVELSSIFKALPRIVNFGLAVFVCGCAGFWLSTSPMWQTAAVGAVSPGEPDQANGRNLFFAGQCTACHASAGQADPYRLGGGRPLHISGIGTFYPPNISPDARFGIGAWSAQDFLQALRAGVSPDGRHYFPVFPYTSFARMSASDIRDLYAFLRPYRPFRIGLRPMRFDSRLVSAAPSACGSCFSSTITSFFRMPEKRQSGIAAPTWCKPCRIARNVTAGAIYSLQFVRRHDLQVAQTRSNRLTGFQTLPRTIRVSNLGRRSNWRNS